MPNPSVHTPSRRARPAVLAAGTVVAVLGAVLGLWTPSASAGAGPVALGRPPSAVGASHGATPAAALVRRVTASKASVSPAATKTGVSKSGAPKTAATPPVVGAVVSGRNTLTYCDEAGQAETLDVYEPSPLPTAPVPAVLYVHGGGWVQGDSTLAPGSLVERVAMAMVARGWIFVSINYRLAPQFRWPAQIDDASCALRFLRAAAGPLHIASGHIGVMGDSAGGQIVSLLGLAGGSAGSSPGRSAGFDAGPYASQSTAVEAVVDLYGPADLTTPDWADAPLIQVYAPQAFGTKLGPGAPGAATTAALVAASPVTYVGGHAPPFLIVQGEQDTVVPPDQSEELAARLGAAGDGPTLVMVDHAEHGLLPAAGGAVTPSISALAAETTAFLVRHLAPPRPGRTGLS